MLEYRDYRDELHAGILIRNMRAMHHAGQQGGMQGHAMMHRGMRSVIGLLGCPER